MNYWMERVAESKRIEAKVEQRLRWEAVSEEIQWRVAYVLVAIAGIGVCWLKTVAVGGPAAIPFFVGLSLLTIGATIGCWRMGNR